MTHTPDTELQRERDQLEHERDQLELESTLLRAVNTLLTLELVLTRASEDTHKEITTILTEQVGNHGGSAILIDMTQLDRVALERQLNTINTN